MKNTKARKARSTRGRRRGTKVKEKKALSASTCDRGASTFAEP
jgi:hypothetical protein